MSKDFIGDGTFRTLLNLMKNKFNTVDGKITDLESGILQSIKNEIDDLRSKFESQDEIISNLVNVVEELKNRV